MTLVKRIVSTAALTAIALATTAIIWASAPVPPEPIAPRAALAAAYTPTSPISPPIPVPGQPI